ncbi:diacylglycerol kinase [Thorsellia anophelis]|uniref:Diacylglycerol kinase n=1 Tax=Thorsellia anophelis DSM 18579 TaxID=1123402 RepID=A0A1H9YVX9_9GAMM|nr:diacylglycerol kinase [Thorsellia anophelis]SES73367.1 diacylglycerol kinase [Thorsellia anophelis DSM 18579]
MIKQSLIRIYKAFGYSKQGLKSAYQNERAFKEEVWLLVIAIILGVVLNITVIEKFALVAVVLLMMIVELLNSAIEAVVDRIGPEHHELSGRAKDMGSAAVLLAGALVCCVWGYIIIGYICTLLSN